MRPHTSKLALALAGSLALLAALGVAGGYHLRNQLVALDVAVDTQWKQVENQLVRQHELLPKLVKVTERYVSHEREVLEKLFRARERYAQAAHGERPQIAGNVDGLVTRAIALAESYPQLAADSQFRDLSHEIAGTKNRIALERKRYNDLVGALNAHLRQMPWRLVAQGLEPRSYYEAPAEQLEEPALEL